MRAKITKYAGWIRLIAFIFGFIILNAVFCFLFVPAGEYSRQVQHDAVTPENTYDLISFGASDSLRTWDPQTADALLGTHSFNMGSSATILNGGIYATFMDTMSHQNPERVIFILGRFEMTSDDDEDPISYIGIAPYLSSPKFALDYYFRTIHMKGAVQKLFPWTTYHVGSMYELTYHLKKKVSKEYLEYDTDLLQTDYLVYKGQGFSPMTYSPENIISYDNMNEKMLKPFKDPCFRDKERAFTEKKSAMLKKMIAYCHERNCDVVVLSAPIPVLGIWSDSYYHSYSSQLKELVEGEGAHYYDLNFAKKELWDPELDDFYDLSHFNEKGAKRVTESICKLLLMQDNGEDVSGLFYSTWDEYLKSIDYAIATYMLVEESESEILVTAHCVTGTDVTPQFRFVIYDVEHDQEVKELQDFDTTNEIMVPKELLSEKSIALRVYANVLEEKSKEHVRYCDYQLTEFKESSN